MDSGGALAQTGRLTFIGTATVLIEVAGVRFLTDPNFLHQGQHAKLGYGLRSRRLTEPAMSIADLPPLDFVLLSHHHGDHFDEVAADELPRDVPIITNAHAARKLRRQGFSATVALDTWDAHVIRRGATTVTVTSLPAKHAPQPLRALLPPVMGSMVDVEVDGGRRLRLYVTGDTLVDGGLEAIAQRFEDIDLCVIHLGGTKIAGVLLTMDAEQGVRALQIVRPATAVPVHYDDYTVFKSPLADFRQRAGEARLTTTIVYLERGESHVFALRST
jgi:L-ascorbate metabolism protein UlaG (beta-lactamase superfamily)